MIVGRGNLIKLFPDFEKDIAENGIDLRVGKLYKNYIDNAPIGSINNEKHLPNLIEVNQGNYYVINPGEFYIVEIDRPIHIPDGYTQLYKIRSTFARCGLLLLSAVGDNGFNGTLRMGLKNISDDTICIGKNERIIQAVTFKNDGTASLYDGAYQNDKFYKNE